MDNEQKEDDLKFPTRRKSISSMLSSQEDYSQGYIQHWLNEGPKKPEEIKNGHSLSQTSNNKNQDKAKEEKDEHVNESATEEINPKTKQKNKDTAHKYKKEKNRSKSIPYSWDRNWILADGRFQNLMESYAEKQRVSRQKSNEESQQEPIQNSS